MKTELNISLSPPEASDAELLKKNVADRLNIHLEDITGIVVLKRSIDARSRAIKINLRIEVWLNETPELSVVPKKELKSVATRPSVLIVGAGPAGLFAALQLIELGIKPIVIERGKDVKSRRRDIAAINKEQLVNPDSNYCFGEGGAGTYSDGKLYTRSTKRGDVTSILETFVRHGASPDILIEAHPHIGTNKLPGIIVSIREQIIQSGGEIHFNTRLSDLTIQNSKIKGIIAESVVNGTQQEWMADAVILATGHSARDVFELLHHKGIVLEAKPFAMGVRVEHPQSLIDSLQYHCSLNEVPERRKYLPAAPYSLVHQADGRGVYSFCMCPGGIIAPCATGAEQVVTNGWSPSKRNNPFANSGIVVAIELEDLLSYRQHGVFAGLRFQQELEKTAWLAGGKTQIAPAQRMIDFVNNKLSAGSLQTSYQPGVISAPLHELLPPAIGKRLQDGFNAFGKKMRGYYTNEAIIVGVESRTSSPVRIPRNVQTLQHPDVEGLYPCAEGAGYAGGIVSAAIDGQRCAVAAASFLKDELSGSIF